MLRFGRRTMRSGRRKIGRDINGRTGKSIVVFAGPMAGAEGCYGGDDPCLAPRILACRLCTVLVPRQPLRGLPSWSSSCFCPTTARLYYSRAPDRGRHRIAYSSIRSPSAVFSRESEQSTTQSQPAPPGSPHSAPPQGSPQARHSSPPATLPSPLLFPFEWVRVFLQLKSVVAAKGAFFGWSAGAFFGTPHHPN